MKSIKFLQTAILIMLVAAAASCSTNRQFPSERYPQHDRNIVIITNRNPQNLPPGQAKKIYGGQSAKPYAYGQQKKHHGYDYRYRRIPLIIIRTPDIIIGRNHDGRYYHRNADGFIYWQGYDSRFYIDETYLNRISYDNNEYNDWRYKGKNRNENKNRDRGHNDDDDDEHYEKHDKNGKHGRGHH
jgi:hypothetical protein